MLGTLPVHPTIATRRPWTARLGPAEGSRAQGVFALTRVRDGPDPDGRMPFALAVWNLARDDDVVQAHIHDRDTDEILAWLFPVDDQRAKEREGFFATVGRFGVDELTGNQGVNDLDALVTRIDAGETIVNAHSIQHPVVATGPLR